MKRGSVEQNKYIHIITKKIKKKQLYMVMYKIKIKGGCGIK